MEAYDVIRETWLSRKPNQIAYPLTVLLGFSLIVGSFLYWSGLGGLDQKMAASPQLVFEHHQWWRAWTALFAHHDIGHLLNNSLLFLPFAYLLSGYFGWLLFPTVGLLIGGLINFVVLATLPAQTSLVGISGVVYWMGATWITLFVLIERGESLRRRMAKALILSAVLFFPQSFQPEISYLSHFLGFASGLLTATVFFAITRKKIRAAEVIDHIIEEDYSVADEDFPLDQGPPR